MPAITYEEAHGTPLRTRVLAPPRSAPRPVRPTRFVEVFEIDQRQWAAALYAYSVARRELNLGRFEVRYYAPEAGPDDDRPRVEVSPGATGMFDPETPNIIWIRAGLSPRQTELTLLHEARHLQQRLRHGRPGTLAEWERRERDAERFETVMRLSLS